jgi:hypothetical protein
LIEKHEKTRIKHELQLALHRNGHKHTEKNGCDVRRPVCEAFEIMRTKRAGKTEPIKKKINIHKNYCHDFHQSLFQRAKRTIGGTGKHFVLTWKGIGEV